MELSPDVGLLRSVFSKDYMNSDMVMNADGLSSACAFGFCVERWGCMVFSVFFWFLVSVL